MAFDQSLLWQTNFCSIMKSSGFFKQKSGTFEGLIYFQKFLGLLMIFAPSAMINLKMITTIFILMSCNSRKKMKIFCKASFLDLSIEAHYRKYTTELFNKRDLFTSISITCPIWIAMCNLKYFILQLVLKFCILAGQ